MVSKELDLRDSLKLNFTILSIFGYWTPKNLGKFLIIYRIYSVIIVGVGFLLYTLTEFINLTMSLHDLMKLTDGLFLFLTHFAQVFKLYYFYGNHEKIGNLLNSLNREIFKPRNEKQLKMIKSKMFYSKNTYVSFALLCICTVLLWAAFPLMDKKEGGKIGLPLSAWYPFDTDETPIFQIIYLYQIISVIMDAITNISMDTLASGLMAHICGQLDVLNDSFLNLRDQALINIREKNQQKRINETNEYFKRILQQEMDKELIRCIVHHSNILE